MNIDIEAQEQNFWLIRLGEHPELQMALPMKALNYFVY